MKTQRSSAVTKWAFFIMTTIAVSSSLTALTLVFTDVSQKYIGWHAAILAWGILLGITLCSSLYTLYEINEKGGQSTPSDREKGILIVIGFITLLLWILLPEGPPYYQTPTTELSVEIYSAKDRQAGHLIFVAASAIGVSSILIRRRLKK